MVCKLNDLTKEQMAAIMENIELRKLAKQTDIRCATCGKAFTPARLWQRFCSPRCRTTYHRGVADATLAELLRENAELRRERDDLVRECAELRRVIPTVYSG